MRVSDTQKSERLEADGDSTDGISDEQPADAFELLDEEPEPVPLTLFPLCTNEGRKGFLEEYIFWGDERLFEAVAHIWDSLNEPKTARCNAVGLAAGTGGTGKSALAKFLKRALRAAIDYEVRPPWKMSYDGLEDLHRAAMSYFADEQTHYQMQIQKYADILDGQPGRHQPHRFTLLIGPWRPAGVIDHEVRDEPVKGAPQIFRRDRAQ